MKQEAGISVSVYAVTIDGYSKRIALLDEQQCRMTCPEAATADHWTVALSLGPPGPGVTINPREIPDEAFITIRVHKV